MTLAIMQPYIFPYLGYFQLISASDKFVIYDDVNFIKQGWINRNYISVQAKPVLFTIPLKNISSNEKISKTLIDTYQFGKWHDRFRTTITNAYSKAPFFENTFSLIETVLSEKHPDIAALCRQGLKSVCNYLEIKTIIADSSEVYGNSDMKGQKRIIDICKKEHADRYINMIGGAALYSKAIFAENNITLNFIEYQHVEYRPQIQPSAQTFSIIDVLMFNSPEKILRMLDQYKLS